MNGFPSSHRVTLRATLVKDLDRCAASFLDPNFGESGTRTRELANELSRRCPSGLDWLEEVVLTRLHKDPYCVLLSDVPMDEKANLLVALSGLFGEVADPHRKPWSLLVQTISPKTDKRFGIFGKLAESLHTDGAGWPRPNDLTCLYCRSAATGQEGRSRLLGIDSLHKLVRKRYGASALDLLRECLLPWKIEDDLGGGVTWTPILHYDAVRWMRYTIEEGYHTAATKRTSEADRALEMMDSLNDRPNDLIEFDLQARDLLIVHNRKSLHGRTPVSDEAAAQRVLLRTRVYFETEDASAVS